MVKTGKLIWQAKGNARQKRLLEALVLNNSLAHAYLFIGPANVGKTALALDLARILVCQNPETRPCGKCNACKLPPDANPDILLIEADPITVAMVRKIKERFALKSFNAGRRVVIIAGAHRLNQEAANALLKFLEEPDPSTTIILTSPSLAMPDTILSRVQKIFFSKASEKELEELSLVRSLPKKEMKKAVESAYGRLQLLQRMCEDPDFRDKWLTEERMLSELLASALPERMAQSSELAARESAELKNLFLHWQMSAESQFSSDIEKKAIAERARLLRSISEVLSGLDFNANKKLLLDNFTANLSIFSSKNIQ